MLPLIASDPFTMIQPLNWFGVAVLPMNGLPSIRTLAKSEGFCWDMFVGMSCPLTVSMNTIPSATWLLALKCTLPVQAGLDAAVPFGQPGPQYVPLALAR